MHVRRAHTLASWARPLFRGRALGLQLTQANVQFWIIAVPVFVAFIAVMGIGAWIGWTMATTPTPKPIEEITSADETKPTENKEP